MPYESERTRNLAVRQPDQNPVTTLPGGGDETAETLELKRIEVSPARSADMQGRPINRAPSTS
jgi:hypothetical protein